jgi:hypothetical protein
MTTAIETAPTKTAPITEEEIDQFAHHIAAAIARPGALEPFLARIDNLLLKATTARRR